jgi:hypothetical protein
MVASKGVDLAQVFKAVGDILYENRDSLNQADNVNHDHGDNMVQTFDLITNAVKEKKNASPSDQLQHAADLVRQRASSGSSKLYADGLADASTMLAGQKSINSQNAMQLVQTLLGTGESGTQPSSQGNAAADILGSLLGGQADVQSPQNPSSGENALGGLLGSLFGQQSEQAPGEAGDLLGSLLGGLTTGESPQGSQKIDLGTMINAGMSFMQTKQNGGSTMDALLQAMVGSSRMNSSNARSQSGALVATTLIEALGKALKK